MGLYGVKKFCMEAMLRKIMKNRYSALVLMGRSWVYFVQNWFVSCIKCFCANFLVELKIMYISSRFKIVENIFASNNFLRIFNSNSFIFWDRRINVFLGNNEPGAVGTPRHAPPPRHCSPETSFLEKIAKVSSYK